MNAHTNPNPVTGQQQRLSAILSQVATVTSIKVTSLGLSRQDKQASAELDNTHQTQGGTFRANAMRLTREGIDRVKEINGCHAAARGALLTYTTAWGDRRLLANVNIQPFLAEYGPAKAEHDRLVEQMIANAPRLIAEAEQNLRTTNVAPPTIEEIEAAFSLDFTMEQIPDSATFTGSGMDKAVEEELKRRFEANIESAYQQAQNDALTRLQKPLLAIVERMEKYNQREEDAAKGLDVGKEGYFRDTIITNLQQIGQVFQSFNLTNDPALAKIAEKLDAFDGIEAKDLRNSKALRDDTAKRAREILENLGGWL